MPGPTAVANLGDGGFFMPFPCRSYNIRMAPHQGRTTSMLLDLGCELQPDGRMKKSVTWKRLCPLCDCRFPRLPFQDKSNGKMICPQCFEAKQ